jgi:archaellum component FlaC
MNDINQTAENIKRLEAFLKNIKMNFNDHRKQAKNSDRLDDIENSIAFLKDYNEVTNELVKVMEAYDKKTSGEIRF